MYETNDYALSAKHNQQSKNAYILKNVAVRSKDALLLNLDNLELSSDSTHLVVGNNSGGKSTFLHLLQGILPFQQKFQGTIVRPSYPSAVVMQGSRAGLNPQKKLISMINELYKVYHFEFPYKKLLDAFALLTNVVQLYPFELSVGMAQRAMYLLSVLALLGKLSRMKIEPELSNLKYCWILLDELDSSLDQQNLKLVLDFTKRYFVNKIIVSHSAYKYQFESVNYVCIENGNLLFSGSHAQVQNHHDLHTKQKILSYIE